MNKSPTTANLQALLGQMRSATPHSVYTRSAMSFSSSSSSSLPEEVEVERLQYGFNRNSQRTWRRRTLATYEDNHYSYDGLSQVTESARGSLNLNTTAISGRPNAQQAWTYDPTGNWSGFSAAENGNPVLDQHRVHDKGNRLTQIVDDPVSMLLDRSGRMLQASPDAGGDWDGAMQFTWDAWSRITSVKNNGTVVGTYEYDGLSRRTTRTVSEVKVHSYYNDVWRPVEERSEATPLICEQNFWGVRHRDDLVRRHQAMINESDEDDIRYVLMDYFNPAAITDQSGNVLERYAFSAFGVRRVLAPDFTPRADSLYGIAFAFQGQFLDSESGLYNYGYRYYSPHLGRWTCKDPIGEEGGLNLYGMCLNDVINYVDHLGLAGEYGTEEEAAKAALAEDKEQTKQSDDLSKRDKLRVAQGRPQGWFGVEYCGLICAKKGGGCEGSKFTYTGPRTDHSTGTCNPDLAPCPEGWNKVGEHHSHPDASTPSKTDHSKIPIGMTGYVGSGSGTGPDYKYKHTYQDGQNGPLKYPARPF